MKPNKLLLFKKKIKRLFNSLAVFLLKANGLKMGKGSTLGKITCDWPNKLIIGHSCVIQDAVDFRIW